MAKKTVKKTSTEVADYSMQSEFYDQVRSVIVEARKFVHAAANTAMVKAYWLVGKMIVDRQGGVAKAAYGDGLIAGLSERLTDEFGKGFGRVNLFAMRKFYLAFPKVQTLSEQLNWSQYQLLIAVENEEARAYYADECIKAKWGVRELRRQINSFYFERLLVNRAKHGKKTSVVPLKPKKSTPELILRDPLVFEFLGLQENSDFLEKDLERLLITHLQKFLLELGRGFSFVGRQQRLTVDGEHYHVDLVFYNYLLKCFVLVDLKTDRLTHADLGQMQMYVNYYERELMNPGDNPPIGIVLCTDKGADLVRYTLPVNEKRIFAAKYKLVLPTEQELLEEIRRETQVIENATAQVEMKKGK